MVPAVSTNHAAAFHRCQPTKFVYFKSCQMKVVQQKKSAVFMSDGRFLLAAKNRPLSADFYRSCVIGVTVGVSIVSLIINKICN